MKTNVQQTSILAYIALNDLSHRQQQVYQAIRTLGTACNLDIAKYLDMPINSITPRTNELVAKGLVTANHRDVSETGRLATYWSITAETPSYEELPEPSNWWGRAAINE